MSRASNHPLRRRQIAEALLSVMAKKGYDGASIADVARAAGLSPGLVHYHFAGKLEILLAALEVLVTRHAARLDERLDKQRGAARQVRAFIDAHLALRPDADPTALGAWVTLGGEALRQPRVQRAYEAALSSLVTRLEELVKAGVRTGELRCKEPRSAAAAVVAAIQGHFLVAASAPGLLPPGSAAPSVRRMAEALIEVRQIAAAREPS